LDLGDISEIQCEYCAFCFDIIATNPSFICCDEVLQKDYHQHLHGPQALYRHQHDFVAELHSGGQHKFVCNTMNAQIFSENLMPHGF
jgi:hypothetical protein